MIDFKTLSTTGRPLLMPGAHDALSARMIQEGGFSAYGVGGLALAATQLALPDAGLQSFGEYRDAVGRILESSSLPAMIDGENGFGDVKAVTRTVRSFERLGVAAIAIEDVILPRHLGRPPSICPAQEIGSKLQAALAARASDDFLILGRTDATYLIGLEEALARAKAYADIGVDGVVLPGLPNLDAYKRLRDAVRVPIVAVTAPGSPWFAPSVEQMIEVGIEAAVYPLMILARVIVATRQAIVDFSSTNGALPPGFDMGALAQTLHTGLWTAVDERFA
jgi:2-methylisocitrate lyase-like PEP mutase family enzyme